jgi:hypothetical protein
MKNEDSTDTTDEQDQMPDFSAMTDAKVRSVIDEAMKVLARREKKKGDSKPLHKMSNDEFRRHVERRMSKQEMSND